MEAVRVMLKRSLLGLVVIAGVVFIAVMLQILFQIFPWSLDALNFTRDRAEWPSVQGTIALASDRNTQGYVSVSFEYQIKDVTYFTVQRWAADQPGYFKGQKVAVHYDPLNPNVAVVNTSKSEMPLESSIIVIIVGLIALGALAGIVVWACWGLDLPGMAAVALGLGVDYFKYRSLGIVFWIMVGIAALPVMVFLAIAIRDKWGRRKG
jgi:hypothetical protein